MERYQPVFRGKPWTEGLRVLHIYAVPSFEGDLARLIYRCRRAMDGTPILPTSEDFLHITLDVVTAADSSGVTERQRADLVSALRDELADVTAFDLTLGSPLAVRSGVILDAHPDDEIDDLRQHVRYALARAVRSDRYYSAPAAHLSLGYAYRDRNGDQLAEALRQVRPSHATTRIDAVHLVDVLFQEAYADGHPAWELTWEPVAEIRLRSADPDDETVWIQQGYSNDRRWTARLLRRYADGLGPEGKLVTWRICATPGEPVGTADLGAFVLPAGTAKEQRARASVGARQGHKQGRALGYGMPFEKADGTGQVTYTATPEVARILTDAIRSSADFAHLCRIQPLLHDQAAAPA
ncbi:2'-5' RNA ligase family protein [Streptacidiphilus anmyonensis]|uniref:2'-5' RNA ligase family protein n=1 Tax=Streptacidiphilus anmyonensis TaxID=405782 RepID=UPI0005A8D9E2|nr:2'-5' RNA ligase family protein [Streptacidiphilus anmyonensis]